MTFSAEVDVAIAREAKERSETFLGLSETVGAFEFRPFAIYDYCALRTCGNIFVCGIPENSKTPEIELIATAAASFVWLQCVEYSMNNPAAKKEIEARIFEDPPLADALTQFIAAAWTDSPATSAPSGVQKSFWSLEAYLCFRLGKLFGWTPAQSMRVPLKQVWQFLKIDDAEKHPNRPLFNPSDQAIGDWINTQNARN